MASSSNSDLALSQALVVVGRESALATAGLDLVPDCNHVVCYWCLASAAPGLVSCLYLALYYWCLTSLLMESLLVEAMLALVV